MLYDPDEDKDIYTKESLRRLRAELYRTPGGGPPQGKPFFSWRSASPRRDRTCC